MYQTKLICRKHTNLRDPDIEKICGVAAQLQLIADLAQANVFIDCPAREGKHAVVVAQANPRTTLTLYTKSVIGQLAYESYEPAVALTHRTGKPTIRNRAITQEGKLVKQSVVPIKNDQGATIGSLIMEQAINWQLLPEYQWQALSKTREHLGQTLIQMTKQESFVFDLIQEALFLIDHQGMVVYANSHAINLVAEMGHSGEFVGTSIYEKLSFLTSIDLSGQKVFFQEVSSGKKTFTVKSIILQRDNQRMGTLLLIRDLTELREKERQLMVKSTVIKEIHHRVKNNLQMIASLLRLQMRRGVPEEAKALFQESLNRIQSIASVHEILSNTGLDEVELPDMVKKIGQLLVNNARPEKNIEISFTGDRIRLPSDKAVSLALIVNELIQNSVEHAFVGQVQGIIRVNMVKVDQEVQVHIKDNGVGCLPSSANHESSLGLQIVKMLTEHDLAGFFSIVPTESGTEAVVRFSVGEGI
ncbi:histidine kinase N-terminal domain-containing protein [Paenactinomyces guangxiensis]|uniref:sensor histidine kinase n=1 Tax=Paenactinomyces guangxiensis TaxID=1490290 RepID=UPI001C68C23B|nr:sensor histidine kinase [Paenactinomyces guangxiensis]